MSRRRALQLLGSIAVIVAIVLGVVSLAGGASSEETAEPAATPTTATTTTSASSDEREAAKEIRALAEAWYEGGGHYGYPFWAKAYERWKAKSISPSVFREYVTGYRDNLQRGCELLDTIDVNHDASRDVRDLIMEACRARVDALRAQKRELDATVKRGATPVADLDAEERASLAGEIAEQNSIVVDKLQQSWRNTRLAMDRAQAQLDESGLDRLREDAIL